MNSLKVFWCLNVDLRKVFLIEYYPLYINEFKYSVVQTTEYLGSNLPMFSRDFCQMLNKFKNF